MNTKTIRIGAVFRPDDEDAVTVLRLVAVANDLGMLFRMMLQYTQVESPSAYGRSLADSARVYACRMGTIHLPDAWKLLSSGDFRRAEARLSRRLAEVTTAAERCRSAMNREPLRELVAGVRNDLAGHPNARAFKRALELVQGAGLMDLPTGSTDGHGDHFNVTDRLYSALLAEDSHNGYGTPSVEESVGILLEEIINAQNELRNLAAVLVVAMYLDNVR